MRTKGLKTQGYKTGGTLRRGLLCIALGALIWLGGAQLRAQLGMPLTFSLGKKEAKPAQTTDVPQKNARASAEISLTGRTWYALQLGAFTQENAAWQLSQEFIPRGAAGYVCVQEGVFRVYAAAYPTRAEAQSVQTRLSDQGVTTYIQLLNEPAVTLRAAGTQKQVEAVSEALQYLNTLSTKFLSLSTALDRQEMDAASAFSALNSEGSTCIALQKALENAFDGEVDAAVQPLHALLVSLAGECSQNNLSAARTGAALKRCQLTVAVGLREFAAQTAGES